MTQGANGSVMLSKGGRWEEQWKTKTKTQQHGQPFRKRKEWVRVSEGCHAFSLRGGHSAHCLHPPTVKGSPRGHLQVFTRTKNRTPCTSGLTLFFRRPSAPGSLYPKPNAATPQSRIKTTRCTGLQSSQLCSVLLLVEAECTFLHLENPLPLVRHPHWVTFYHRQFKSVLPGISRCPASRPQGRTAQFSTHSRNRVVQASSAWRALPGSPDQVSQARS